VPPQDASTCPTTHPIKGNFTTYSGERCIYHVPGGEFYVKTNPERCYATDEALEDCTRLRVLRLYPRQHQLSSLEFLGEVQRGFPFPIHRLQTDNGSEFPLAFALAVQKAGTGLMPRSFGIGTTARASMRRRWRCKDGRRSTTAFGFRWRSTARPRLRNSRPCSQRPEHDEPPTLRPLNRSKPGSRS
jgi:hypothetical protein